MDQKLAYMEQLTVDNLAKKIRSFIEPTPCCRSKYPAAGPYYEPE